MCRMTARSCIRVVAVRIVQSSGSAVQVLEEEGTSEADEGLIVQQEVTVAWQQVRIRIADPEDGADTYKHCFSCRKNDAGSCG